MHDIPQINRSTDLYNRCRSPKAPLHESGFGSTT